MHEIKITSNLEVSGHHNISLIGSEIMPVHKVVKNGRTGYQWGSQGKVYTGPGARERATRQGQAAHAAGYKTRKK